MGVCLHGLAEDGRFVACLNEGYPSALGDALNPAVALPLLSYFLRNCDLIAWDDDKPKPGSEQRSG